MRVGSCEWQTECDGTPGGCYVQANFTITFATSSGADVIPESCLDSGGTCTVGMSHYPMSGGRTWELFAGVAQNQFAVTVEGCSGTPMVTVCLGGGTSKCSDPTNPVRHVCSVFVYSASL